jgi:Putative ER transporter, 6TM, N-terminal
MAGITMIIGMALGWAWGVISMKAALATRSSAETNARLQQLAAATRGHQTNTEQATGQSAYTQILIYDGFMLDTRVSATYFCMLGLFIYLVVMYLLLIPSSED